MVDDSFQENPFTTISGELEVMGCHTFIHLLQECLMTPFLLYRRKKRKSVTAKNV